MASDKARIALVFVLFTLGDSVCVLAGRPDGLLSPADIASTPKTADFEFPWIVRCPLTRPSPRFFPIDASLAARAPAPRDDGVIRTQELQPLEPGAGMPSLMGDESPPFSPVANVDPGRSATRGGEGGAGGGPGAGFAVSGNPAATNIVAGTGRLGEVLGINRNGWRLGGLTIGDANGVLSGGLGPGKWTGNNLTIFDLSLDLEARFGWKGAMIGTEYLYVTSGGPGYTIDGIVQNRGNINALAGSLMGINCFASAGNGETPRPSYGRTREESRSIRITSVAKRSPSGAAAVRPRRPVGCPRCTAHSNQISIS